MNHKMKVIAAAAVAALGVTAQAHALTATNVSTGDMFLYVFEDRALNSGATNTAVFDLGAASNFATGANQSFDFSANSAWTSYISTITNPANIKWGVFGATGGTGGLNTVAYTTASSDTMSLNGNGINIAVSKYNTYVQPKYGSACITCGFNVADSAGDVAGDNWNNILGGGATANVTAGLGSNLDFFSYKVTSTKGTTAATKTSYLMADGSHDYFKLDSTGKLSYTTAAVAAVPEADTYALMLAGMGLVGFMARRRRAV